MIVSDKTTSSNYWSTRRVTFSDGSFVLEHIPGPLAKSKSARRGFPAPGKPARSASGNIISKKAFDEAVKAGTYSG